MEERKVIEVVPTEKRRIVKGEGYSTGGYDSWLHPEVEGEAGFDKKVKVIVKQLVEKRDFPDVGNFYTESEAKQLNLIKYFNALFWNKPEYMFIGEAPGVDGCVKTGIPFTSEKLIRLGQFERQLPGMRFVIEGDKAERSATVIWGSVGTLPKTSVMWNVFPLHPHNESKKNRTPIPEEIEWGMTILPSVVELFPGVKVVSVGKIAKSACRRLRIKTVGHLNHPRRADIFREQFANLFPKK